MPLQQVSTLYTKKAKEHTILDILRPIGRGEPSIATGVQPIPGKAHKFNFDLIPGHPKLALLEDKFSSAWLAFEGGDFAGVRQTNWVNQLRQQVNRNFDLVFFDVGPSLGALNRSVLLGTEFFVTPLSCDIFSIAGLENISEWFKQWMNRYGGGIENCRKQGWGEDLDDYPIQTSTAQMARFVGCTVQQYITKIRHGERRPTIACERIRKRIPEAVSRSVQEYIRPGLSTEQVDLGDVPNMFSLVLLAQSASRPVFALEAQDGINGSQYSQRDTYAKFMGLRKNLWVDRGPGEGRSHVVATPSRASSLRSALRAPGPRHHDVA